MEFERFFKFSQLLLRDEFVLSYSGYVSEDILLAVGETLRARLERCADPQCLLDFRRIDAEYHPLCPMTAKNHATKIILRA